MLVRFLAGLTYLGLAAAAPPQSVPADLNDFGLVCFCNSRVATPHMIVGLDNNGHILSLLRTPKTKADIIAAGQPILDSQLRTLRDWGLVKQEGDRFSLAFPVFGPPEMAALRGRLAPVADRIAQASSADLADIAAEVRRRGRAESAHALLFAYVLDGLVWRDLEERNLLPAQDITVSQPYWAGTFWAVFPKQDDMPGTNDISVGDANLRMMWTPAVLHHFSRLVNDSAVRSWLESIDSRRAPPPKSPVDRAIVVDERTDDPIHLRGKAIAHRVTEEIVNIRLDDLIPDADGKQRVVIATHELIWLVLERMSRAKDFAPPTEAASLASDYAELDPLLVIALRKRKP